MSRVTDSQPMTRKELSRLIRRDVAANKGYPKSVVVLVLLRMAQYVRAHPGLAWRVGYLLTGALYKFVSEWCLGVEIPASTRVGAGLRLRHGVGTVVNPFARIGEDVMLRQGVTIGNRRSDFDCPTIGDEVEIGAGACLIGEIRVGRGARIGAGAIVVSDVPEGGVAYASPATVKRSSSSRGSMSSGD